jgi:cell wall-associated NlpC family hydrolase
LPFATPDALTVSTIGRSTFGLSARRMGLIFLAALLALSMLAIEAPSDALGRDTSAGRYGRTEAQRIVHFARTHLGKRFRLGTEGPRYFDCSGLVYRVYKQAGLLNRVGGSRKLAAGYYQWFKRRGLASRRNPRVGDIVIWREHGRISHTGIYVGSGRVISALVNPWGVTRTRVNSLRGARLYAYLHVRIDR